MHLRASDRTVAGPEGDRGAIRAMVRDLGRVLSELLVPLPNGGPDEVRIGEVSVALEEDLIDRGVHKLIRIPGRVLEVSENERSDHDQCQTGEDDNLIPGFARAVLRRWGSLRLRRSPG